MRSTRPQESGCASCHSRLGSRPEEQRDDARPSARPGRLPVDSPRGIDRQPLPAFPLAARLPVVVGEPSEPGPYVVRVKVPSSVNSCRTSTRRTASTGSCPASSTFHFHWAKSREYITQVTGIGPLSLEYLNPIDDPRNQRWRARRRGFLRGNE